MEQYFKKRLSLLKKRLENKNVDSYISFKPENIYYLSGFFALDSGTILMVTKKDVFLLVHFNYYEKAKKTVVFKDIKIIQFLDKRLDIFKEIMAGSQIDVLGIESDSIDFNTFNNYKKIIKRAGKKLKNLPYFINTQRMVKDSFELSQIKKACNITDKTINFVLNTDYKEVISVPEIEMALKIEAFMINKGASSKSFDLVVANNKNSSLPHYESSYTIIKPGTCCSWNRIRAYFF